jgi:hypothetical protein
VNPALFFQKELISVWKSIGEENRPWGIWLVEHLPVEDEFGSLSTPVLNAWFLDQGVIVEKCAMDFVRFVTVQNGTHWNSAFFCPPSVFGRRHEIGLARFAPLQRDPRMFYFEWIFGGLFGAGSRYTLREDGSYLCDRNIVKF